MPKPTLQEYFPLSDKPGSDYSDVDYKHLRHIAESSKAVTPQEFQQLLHDHKEFIKLGGGGGQWQTMNINGVILGIYLGKKEIKGQAVLNNRRLDQLKLAEISLPYSNLVGILAEGMDWHRINLNHSLITDSMLKNTCFDDATCIGTDFSRSDLRNCSFRNANLKYADFENCNLEGADFTGANLKNARFPGANLANVVY
ncbi:MAG: pentapeptide repeat-containing protein [Candidatus Lokiarchaeota archaeon]|nr:pentapeptide repeat-containing protein [Candidatus Harpocratesius repetitus]